MKAFSIAIASSVLLLASCGSEQSSGYKSGNAQTFDSLITTLNNEQLVDVRTPEEYNAGHLEGAQNYDWKNNDFSINVGALDKSKPVLVYCQSGNRSKQAAEYLANNGFTAVYELDGGISSWEAAGKPTEKMDEAQVLASGVSLAQY